MKHLMTNPLTNKIFLTQVQETARGLFLAKGKQQDYTDEAIGSVFEWFMNNFKQNEPNEAYEITYPDCPYILRMIKKKQQNEKVTKKVHAAFLQVPIDCGLPANRIPELLGKLNDKEVIPIEIQAENACAVGFISLDAADALDYDYDDLSVHVKDILLDQTKETKDGYYSFEGFPVYIGY